MGIPVLILGASGSGKSASLRNFASDEVIIFNVAAKPLPFRKRMDKIVNNASYGQIVKRLTPPYKNPEVKTFVIDDSQYLLAFEYLNRAKETGYNKFTEMALNFTNLIQHIIRETPEDFIVYFLHHTERLDDGNLKAKTIGKMLDEKVTLEGLFSIVLLCVAEKDRHYFVTQSQGYSTAKSPMEMFDLEMDNDLKLADSIIREYYQLNGKGDK